MTQNQKNMIMNISKRTRQKIKWEIKGHVSQKVNI